MISSVEELLLREEGERLSAYTDSEGYLTIGVGRLIDAHRGGQISHDESRYMLSNDIKQRIEVLSHSFAWWLSLDEVRRAVCISMMFQVGDLKNWPNFCAAMAAHDYHQAAKCMLDSKVAREQAPARWQRQAMMMETGNWV